MQKLTGLIDAGKRSNLVFFFITKRLFGLKLKKKKENVDILLWSKLNLYSYIDVLDCIIFNYLTAN